ncbi:hypothetical protein MMC30_003406 [Trapelia coarctata]|nr:hypothetical protein [Trapelia coarctata]
MRSSRSSSDASVRSSSPDSQESLHIFVKLLSGESKNPDHSPYIQPAYQTAAIPLAIPPTTTISTLRQLLALRTSLPASSLRLTHAGRHLTTTLADPTLTSLNIISNSTLELTLPVRGGMPPKKVRCTFKDCKDAAQRIIGDCGFCSGHFCGKHRMLEDHKCSGLEDCKKESHERNAIKLNSERTTMVKGI